MNRRDFVKFLALMCAGAAARPEQIEAFERYYEVNSPHTLDGLVAVDEVYLSGMAGTATPLRMGFFPNAEAGRLCLGMNAFGGIVRWAATPDQKIIIRERDIGWSIVHATSKGDVTSGPFKYIAEGHISYIDQNGKRINLPITDWSA